MTRSFSFALIGVCALMLTTAPLCAKESPAAAAAQKATTPPGTEELNVGESPEEAQLKGDSVAAIVNDTVITDYDLRQRIGLYIATSNARPTPEMLKKVRAQVLRQLETERIQLLEAQKNKITVSAADVDKSIDNILRDNHLTLEQLTTILGRSGVKLATMRSQIASQVAWSKAVQAQYGDRVDVTKADVDAELRRLAEGRDKPHFLVSEIFLPVDNPEDDSKVLKNMQDMQDQLRSGASFGELARQFSQNPTAASGGDMGVVVQGQLPKELDDALTQMRPGALSPPIRSTGGYYMLLLRARQEGEGAKVPEVAQKPVNDHPDSLPLDRILMPIGPKPPKELLDKVVNFANNMRGQIQGCDGLGDAIKKMKGVVFMNLGNMRLSDLSPQIQQALAQTHAGEVTVPFQSAAGVELFVRCDKGAPPPQSAFHMPSRDDIEQSLFEQRMAVLSRQYLRDLRRDADIELPGQPLGPRKSSDASEQ
ncbi:MAG TPA: peptidylprolyl isomerase [Rhizomicrobium sp.]|nr:peptidylprolyl isomerase [Rhizomicrobium sp.]